MTGRASLSRIQVHHWLLVAAAAIAYVVARRPGAGGVIVGGTAIGGAVLVYATALQLLVRRHRSRLAIGLLFVKLLAFLGLGWFAFWGAERRPDPIGFVIGITCFPAAAVWEAMRVRGS